MISKIINNSKLNWISSIITPELHRSGEALISDDLILIFDDGFIVRGCYVYDDGWYGYDTNMHLERYISNPKYYLTI